MIAGRDKGQRGLVLNIDKDNNKVIVENVNMAMRHTKGNPSRNAPGGIIQKEMPFSISNIALWNPVANRPDRVGFRFLEDGRKVRYFKSNNEVVDV